MWLLILAMSTSIRKITQYFEYRFGLSMGIACRGGVCAVVTLSPLNADDGSTKQTLQNRINASDQTAFCDRSFTTCSKSHTRPTHERRAPIEHITPTLKTHPVLFRTYACPAPYPEGTRGIQIY